MAGQRVNGHKVSRMTVHIVWSTKYRYPVLIGDVQKRSRAVLIEVCDAEGVQILKGVVSKDHVHMHLEYRPSQDVSTLVKKLKGRSSRKLQLEFPELKKKYWVVTFGRLALVVRVLETSRTKWLTNIWSITGNLGMTRIPSYWSKPECY